MRRRGATAAELAEALQQRYAPVGIESPTSSPASSTVPARRRVEDEIPAIDHQRTLSFFRWYEGILRAHRAAADAVAHHNLSARDPSLAHDDDVTRAAVRGVHTALLRHPVAAKAIAGSLVAEGRRAAQTAEGAALRERLLASPRARRAAVLWRSVTLGLLDGDDGDELPPMYVDGLLQLADSPDLETTLARMLTELEARQ